MSRLEQRLSEKKKNKTKRGLWILIVLAALLIFLVATGASYFLFSTSLFDRNQTEQSPELTTVQNKVNIMVLGVDQREGDIGRSDTLFVVTVDANTKEVAMLSIPRDTRVKIPKHGYDKINHAFAFGGHALSEQAVEGLLGIPIDRYIMIDFNSFTKIVDAIGTVTIDVEKRMYYEDPYDGPDGLVIDLQPGVQQLDGKKAIQYVRYRDEEGDIGRVQRQQKFIKALMKEVASPSVLMRVPAIIQQVSAAIKTDMATTEMLSLARIINDAYNNGLKADMVPGKPAYINDISYWLPDVVALRQHLAQTMGMKTEASYVATAKRQAVEYETSIPKEMKVVDTPKEVKPEPKAKSTEDKLKKKPNQDTSLPKKADAKPAAPSKIKVEILNASGWDGAGARVATELRRQGFEVASVANLTVSYRNTIVVSNTTNSNVVNKLNALPFRYSLQVTKDESKDVQATILIGTDYAAANNRKTGKQK